MRSRFSLRMGWRAGPSTRGSTGGPRGPKKQRFFTVRLTERVGPPSLTPFSHLFMIFLLCFCPYIVIICFLKLTQGTSYFQLLQSPNPTYCCYTAQCVLSSVYISAQTNKLRPILKFEFWYPVEHIFVPACSSALKIHFLKF